MNATDTGGRALRVAVLSFAHVHAASYLSLLRDRPGVELLTADPDAATAPADELRGRDFADLHGVAYVDTYTEVFDWGPDAVIVCAENARHHDLVLAAAAAGAHVLVTAPDPAARSADGYRRWMV
jgi:1,5-anhydro-D-fructose reductase (1,5-anhydro-D-mannitol-forming)